jgi:deoxyribonuclease V
MRFSRSHPPTEITPEIQAAIRLQEELRHQVRLEDGFDHVRYLAGIDSGYDLTRNLNKCVITLMDTRTQELITTVIATSPTNFPYVPGLLSFRELPAILEALTCLPRKPDLLMVDGQGVAHPRRLGIAAHLGVVSGIPSIGVAKSRLCGKHGDIPPEKFADVPLMDKNEMIGYVLRSKEKCNPLYISAGHRISHETALSITKNWITKYRLPEPTRIADQMSKWPL